jgi:uncharacterized DUF497 family protein
MKVTIEVEEVFAVAPYLRRGRGGRYLAYGPTTDGRYLFVVFALPAKGVVRVITARDMTRRQRAEYRRRKR